MMTAKRPSLFGGAPDPYAIDPSSYSARPSSKFNPYGGFRSKFPTLGEMMQKHETNTTPISRIQTDDIATIAQANASKLFGTPSVYGLQQQQPEPLRPDPNSFQSHLQQAMSYLSNQINPPPSSMQFQPDSFPISTSASSPWFSCVTTPINSSSSSQLSTAPVPPSSPLHDSSEKDSTTAPKKTTTLSSELTTAAATATTAGAPKKKVVAKPAGAITTGAPKKKVKAAAPSTFESVPDENN